MSKRLSPERLTFLRRSEMLLVEDQEELFGHVEAVEAENEQLRVLLRDWGQRVARSVVGISRHLGQVEEDRGLVGR